jgi:hypothetical protein
MASNSNPSMNPPSGSTGLSLGGSDQGQRPRSQYGAHSDPTAVAREHLGLTQTLVSPTVTNVKKYVLNGAMVFFFFFFFVIYRFVIFYYLII